MRGADSWAFGGDSTGTAWSRCFSGEVRLPGGESGVGTERSSGMMPGEGLAVVDSGSLEIFFSSSSKTARR